MTRVGSQRHIKKIVNIILLLRTAKYFGLNKPSSGYQQNILKIEVKSVIYTDLPYIIITVWDPKFYNILC
jgi:hypothetical protein